MYLNGSVANIPDIPEKYKQIYKTVWELSQRTLIDMAADRGAFIDQSQSFNVHMAAPSMRKITAMHFHAWRKGLKTGLYYLRTKAATDALKVTVDMQAVKSGLSVGTSVMAPSEAGESDYAASTATPM